MNLKTTVTVDAPARLHFGFLDLHGGLGRRFGSLGVAISGIGTRISVTMRDRLEAHGPDAERAKRYAQQVLSRLPTDRAVALEIDHAIPSHAGLGSGTQLALAVNAGIRRLLEQPGSTEQGAEITGRGARSGVGIGVFDHGGFVVDLGHGQQPGVPPVLSRIEFPAAWRIVLLRDDAARGLSGDDEQRVFTDQAPLGEALAAAVCRHVLMGVIPALLEQDFERFALSLQYIQDRMGDYFAPRQGGARFTSPAVGAAIAELAADYPQLASGQTSWGPTGFICCPSDEHAREIASRLIPMVGASSSLEVSVHAGLNHGARVSMVNDNKLELIDARR